MADKYKLHLLAFCIFMINVPARAQTDACSSLGSCCNSDPTPAGLLMSHTHEQGDWMLSYTYMNTGFEGTMAESKAVDRNYVFNSYLMYPDNMRMDMHMLMGMYGITDKISIMAMAGFRDMRMDMSMFAEGHNHSGTGTATSPADDRLQTMGLADLQLNTLYALIARDQMQFSAGIGLSIPVGSISLKGKLTSMYPNERLPYSMQAGSGTWDVLPSLNYIVQNPKLSYGAQLSAIIRTAENRNGYRLGNEAVLNTWASYKLIKNWRASLRMEGSAAGKINGSDPSLFFFNEPATNPNNYGGKRLDLFFGSTFQFPSGALKNQRLGAEYGIPLYQNLNGIQSALRHTFFLQWSIIL